MTTPANRRLVSCVCPAGQQAHATLDGGKTAEVKLHRFHGMTDEYVVLKNVKYWGTPRNDGFVMMPNESKFIAKAQKRSNLGERMDS